MNYDGWIEGYKVRIMPWIDGKTIYCNVQYFLPGQSLSKPPAWDKSVYITDNEKARNVLKDYIHTLVNYVASIDIQSGQKVILAF